MIDKIIAKNKLVEKALDASWLRNEAISQNIANVDTPRYRRKTVSFEEYLNDEMGKSISGLKTDHRHISIGTQSIDQIEAMVSEDNSNLHSRLDMNNVDIENEMAQLAKNSIRYNALTQRISGSMRSIKSAINEGRR